MFFMIPVTKYKYILSQKKCSTNKKNDSLSMTAI